MVILERMTSVESSQQREGPLYDRGFDCVSRSPRPVCARMPRLVEHAVARQSIINTPSVSALKDICII